MKNKVFIGAILVATAAILWSLDGTLFRPQLHTLPSSVVVFLEHLLGFIVLLPFLFVYKKQLKKINKKTWGAIFWVALFGGALGTTFITKALFLTGFTDISVVILLQKFQPIFAIVLASIFLKEKFPKSFYIYALIAIIAGYFVTFSDPFTISKITSATLAIAGFSLLAAFSWGSSTTFGKYSIKNINYGLLASLRFGITTLIMIVPALFFQYAAFSAINQGQWLILVAVVFTSGAAAMTLYYFGLKRIPASVATLCELAWPVSAIFFDYFFNKNILSATQIIGAAILIWVVYRTTKLIKPHTISGTVVSGMGEGERMGMKTANLHLEKAKNLPKGLYTGQVELENKKYEGLLYYGYNSLSKKDTLEVHILNFEGNAYDKELKFTTDKFLRLPKKFDDQKKLALQLKNDLEGLEK